MTTTSTSSPRQSRPARRLHALILGMLATILVSACSADENGDQSADAPDTSTRAPSPSPSAPVSQQNAGASDGTPIRITFGAMELTARLLDNATARDLAAQLPLTLTFRDQRRREDRSAPPRAAARRRARRARSHRRRHRLLGARRRPGLLLRQRRPVLQRHRPDRRVRRKDGRDHAPTEDFSVTIERAG